MSESVPRRSRDALQWQIVLVDPSLLKAAQKRLRASGPSHAIEEALRLALRTGRPAPTDRRHPKPIH